MGPTGKGKLKENLATKETLNKIILPEFYLRESAGMTWQLIQSRELTVTTKRKVDSGRAPNALSFPTQEHSGPRGFPSTSVSSEADL